MEKVEDIGDALRKVFLAHGMDVEYGRLFGWVQNIARAEATRTPGPQGFQGPMGQQGVPGAPGADAYDKYRWNNLEEALVEFSWKGISFKAPIDWRWASEIPSGELTFGDIALIQMLYGSSVVERMATFWRREYDAREDMSLFINEEELCSLKDIHQSNSSPAPLPDSWAKRYRQSARENPPGT